MLRGHIYDSVQISAGSLSSAWGPLTIPSSARVGAVCDGDQTCSLIYALHMLYHLGHILGPLI